MLTSVKGLPLIAYMFVRTSNNSVGIVNSANLHRVGQCSVSRKLLKRYYSSFVVCVISYILRTVRSASRVGIVPAIYLPHNVLKFGILFYIKWRLGEMS